VNEPSSPVRAAAIDRAARVLEAGRLQVIDRDWQSGEHRLDLVATPGAGILAAVEVRDAPPAAKGADVPAVSATALSEDRAPGGWPTPPANGCAVTATPTTTCGWSSRRPPPATPPRTLRRWPEMRPLARRAPHSVACGLRTGGIR